MTKKYENRLDINRFLGYNNIMENFCGGNPKNVIFVISCACFLCCKTVCFCFADFF